MPKASVKRLIDSRKDKLIEFVLDIEKYPEFIPFCENSKIHEKKDDGNIYKIASIGLKFKKWVSYHGFSLNINPNLNHYSGINPCGLNNKNITSLSDIGINIDNNIFDTIAMEEIDKIFGK